MPEPWHTVHNVEPAIDQATYERLRWQADRSGVSLWDWLRAEATQAAEERLRQLAADGPPPPAIDPHQDVRTWLFGPAEGYDAFADTVALAFIETMNAPGRSERARRMAFVNAHHEGHFGAVGGPAFDTLAQSSFMTRSSLRERTRPNSRCREVVGVSACVERDGSEPWRIVGAAYVEVRDRPYLTSLGAESSARSLNRKLADDEPRWVVAASEDWDVGAPDGTHLLIRYVLRDPAAPVHDAPA